jgi:hypothetical protein
MYAAQSVLCSRILVFIFLSRGMSRRTQKLLYSSSLDLHWSSTLGPADFCGRGQPPLWPCPKVWDGRDTMVACYEYYISDKHTITSEY